MSTALLFNQADLEQHDGPSAWRFEVKSTPTGFLVTHPKNVYTHVAAEWDGFNWRVSSDNKTFLLYEYPGLLRAIAEGTLKDWKGQPDRQTEREKMACAPGYVHPKLKEWKTEKVIRYLGKQVWREWARIVDSANPTVRAVHRAFQSVRCLNGTPEALRLPALYENKLLVHDLVSYQAARAALLVACLDAAWDGFLPEPAGVATETIEIMQDWQTLFSYNRKKYRALNVTLMQLPGGVPARLLSNLRHVHLIRPITERAPLIGILAAAKRMSERPVSVGDLIEKRIDFAGMSRELVDKIKRELAFASVNCATVCECPVLQHATSAQWRRLPKILPGMGRWTQARQIIEAVSYMHDAVHDLEHYPGTLVGLAKRAVDWHRHEEAEQTRQMVERLGGDRKVTLPGIDLPERDGIRFLPTVQDIATEGATMGHCVGSYAPDAVEGNVYVFHVSHKGEEATAAVRRWGSVESHGPHNRENTAARWARGTLRAWGKNLAETPATPALEGAPF